ncbi:hypothetical protein B0H34DRAFT_617022, partial [Crassisporium funariophilum]
HQIRFGDVSPALDHKGKTQFEGQKEFAARVASIYSNSPMAQEGGMKMEQDDWIRKQEFQNMDHAADGKKQLKHSEEWKEAVAVKDLGDQEMDELETDEILQKTMSVTEEEIDAFQAVMSESPEKRHATAIEILERKLGADALGRLKEADRNFLIRILFAGCCGHKDLNAYKYGDVELQARWGALGRPRPVLLANKANDAAIRLSDNPDGATVQNAIATSGRGAVKLASLAGALFHHKSDDQGYQEFHRIFMSEKKHELHGIKTYTRFPDTSNTRYQSHSYAARELVVYLDLYRELLEVARDAKQKAAYNHLEQNVAKGLNDTSTIAELCAHALYGNAVSWLYLEIVRGKGTTIRNLLDNDPIELHRKLPVFCEHIAANPRLLLDPDKLFPDFSTRTLNGRPWHDRALVMAVRTLQCELPDLEMSISAMFAGCAKGWQQFTKEFAPGGPIDSLTPEQRRRMFIPATNDHNEGGLGSTRIYTRSHPNGTAAGFSNKARCERNNTENFILSACTPDDQQYVMREVRRQGASGEHGKFRKDLFETQQKKAIDTRKKQADLEAKRREEFLRLTAVGLVVDRSRICKMTVGELKDQ